MEAAKVSSLYRLKQASRQWISRLVEELLKKEYQQSKNGYSRFIKQNSFHLTIIVDYVYDILVPDNDSCEITNIKTHLNVTFTIKDLGILHYFLGIEISYSSKRTILTQQINTRITNSKGSEISKQLLHLYRPT